MSSSTLFNLLLMISIGLSQEAPPVDEVRENDGKVPPMQMTYFDNSLGTFVEHRGRAAVIMSEWNLIVYYDLQPLYTEIQTFNKNYNKLFNYCIEIPHLLCSLVPKYDINEIEVSSLFGGLSTELDTEYARRMGDIISRIQANEMDFKDMLTNRTSVIDSTDNVMSVSQNKLLSEIEEGIEKLPTAEDTKTVLLSELSVQLRALYGRIKRTQGAILDAVVPAQQGKLNSMILSVKRMKHELTVIMAHLPQDRRLPFNVRTISDVYRVATISHMQLLEKHLLFDIKLPLMDVEEFDVYHLTPIPRIDAGVSIQLIYTETPNLAISDHLDRYFPLQDAELDSCLKLQPGRFLCQAHQITFGRDSGTLPCTLAAIRNRTSQGCVTRHLNQNSLWIPLAAPNRWMLAVTKELSILGVCSDERQHLRISGSGILTIRSDCNVRSTSVTLQGATAGKSYAALTPLEVDEPMEGSAIAIIVSCVLVLIIIVSIAMYWFYQRKARAQQAQGPMEQLDQPKNEVSCNDQPLLEKRKGVE